MDDSFEPEAQSMPSYSEQMAAESTSLRSYQIIASNTLGRISWTLIRDEENDDPYLHIENLPKNLTMKESYFLGFGFTDQIEMLPFSQVVKKIHEHTSSPSSKTAPITPDRQLFHIPSIFSETNLFLQI
jgi:hypothetical protein